MGLQADQPGQHKLLADVPSWQRMLRPQANKQQQFPGLFIVSENPDSTYRLKGVHPA